MKRVITILLGGALAVSLFAHPDINNDGNVDLRDYAELQNAFEGNSIERVTYSFESVEALPSQATAEFRLESNPLHNETVTIGTFVYTFRDVLTDVPGYVLIGDTIGDSLYNLDRAIDVGSYTCSDGYNNGLSCDSDVDCPGIGCVGGSNDGFFCETNEDCTGGGSCDDSAS